MRISDWSSDLCSSDLLAPAAALGRTEGAMEEFTGKVLNEDIVQGMTSFAGFDLLAGALKSYSGASFITLNDWVVRTGPGQVSVSFVILVIGFVDTLPYASFISFYPPPISFISSTCRFVVYLLFRFLFFSLFT